MHLAIRILAIMALGAWTIWPEPWGLGLFTLGMISVNPVVGLTMAILWTIVVFTVLPLKLRHYKLGTQIALIAMVLIMHYQAYAMGFMSLDNYAPWLISFTLSGIFVLVAWPMIANRLWQWTHYQRAVDGQLPDTGEHLH